MLARRTFIAVSGAVALCAASANEAHAVVTINEIRADQDGPDTQEYFELTGSAGESLNTLTYLVIGQNTLSGSGLLETVVSLAGRAIPADGYFLAAEPTFTLAPAQVDFTTAANALEFENDQNRTHLLVAGFSGTDGQDLDTNDDGTLDVTPWTSILDSVAFIENPAAGDKYYSPTTVGPDVNGAPWHLLRLPNATGPWQFESVDGTGTFDTPGASNAAIPEPATVGLAGGAAALGGLRRRRRAAR